MGVAWRVPLVQYSTRCLCYKYRVPEFSDHSLIRPCAYAWSQKGRLTPTSSGVRQRFDLVGLLCRRAFQPNDESNRCEDCCGGRPPSGLPISVSAADRVRHQQSAASCITATLIFVERLIYRLPRKAMSRPISGLNKAACTYRTKRTKGLGKKINEPTKSIKSLTSKAESMTVQNVLAKVSHRIWILGATKMKSRKCQLAKMKVTEKSPAK